MSPRDRLVIFIAAAALIGAIGVLLTRNTRAAGDQRASDVNVTCAPTQRAVVRQTMTGAVPFVDVLCVDATNVAAVGLDQWAPDPMPVRTGAAPALVPAVYAPEVVTPSRAPARVAAQTAPRTARRIEPRKPSWQKRALVIGGTAGAGAGIGALIGGKKGALIGAAIGGGGAALVDQVKHK
jgi:hypothetical protein